MVTINSAEQAPTATELNRQPEVITAIVHRARFVLQCIKLRVAHGWLRL